MSNEADDKTLMVRFQDNADYRAFEELFRRHKDGFVNFLARLSGSQAIAEDISQHSWLKLIEIAERGSYKADVQASFRTYLYTVGRNKYFDEYHRKHQHTKTDSLEDHEQAVEASADARQTLPDEVFRNEQIGDILHLVLQSLPAEQREVIAMWANGIELKQVAEITGVSRHTVLSRKQYAVKKLKTQLERLGVKREIQ